jgi:hypothetical protein
MLLSPEQLACHEDVVSHLNQKTIEELLDQITSILDGRLDRFHNEFQKRFQGYSPEFVSGLVHLQKIDVKKYTMKIKAR